MAAVADHERDAERRFLESLRQRYEDDGFAFTVEPGSAVLPDFLGTYRPDALAQKPGRNVAIEVKGRHSQSTVHALRTIRRLFTDRSDWQFRVYFMGRNPLDATTIEHQEPHAVMRRVAETRHLLKQGHSRAAFVMAWPILEAALQVMEGEASSRPRAPGSVVQTLAMDGHIGPDIERRLRALIDLRTRIVHGDLAAEPAPADVDLVLSGVEETLGAVVS